ncbi:hypothetical protein PNIG_a1554 [Pseudoalteromonas nigrifaciens]|uniref:Large polyvalent protein associated domain-containing protein n=1 Tax=Pseudoalteromonas nigrifaciens TaxID=28109 RepID=A0AAC9XX76_9GAMM|nr:LPD38 domain-containing protein [Pseudoalteromonas nigrifaciens]ASM53702.1 hypothetical protein PNIG_a1554 [Pseudoalteromonas nigrifaciens]GEN40695.1 hypothetical protein PNI02_01610 [Pseudoalteromonas nigrifaciens]SUC52455.1 DNA primase TraC [Pseudoalteromonas nigrifaciens]
MANKIVDPFTNKEIEFIDPFAEPESEGGISAAFGASVDKVQELGYRAVKGFTDTGEKGSEQEEGSISQKVANTIGQGGSLAEWAQEGIDRNVKEQQAYKPTVGSYKDIDSLGDLGSYTGELVAGSLPYMAAAATGVGALGMAGGLSNEAYEKQPEGEKDEVKAVASGAGQMLLERLGIKVSMGQLGKDILKDGVVETAKRMGKGELVDAVRDPSFAKRIFKGAVGEGLTETGQEALAQWGAGKSIDEFEGLDEAFVGGFAVGGVMRTGSESAQKVMGYQKKTAEAVKSGADQLIEAGASPEEAIETVKKQQYEAAIKQGLSDVEASAVVARTMKEKFGIDDPLFAAAAEPVQAQEAGQAQAIPEDTQIPVFENDDIDYDVPTAAREAGFGQDPRAAGQYGDMLTSPQQQSLKDLDAGNNAPTVDERVKAAAFDKTPTPEDRFSPIKYQHEGELLGPDAQNAQGIDNAPIDGQVVPEQGKLPTAEQTKNREMREQAQADIESQPKGIEQKDIIFGEDGRPQQRAAEQVKQAGKDSQNLLPQKDIIFAGNESGVNVAKNGEAFKTKRDALLSKEARAARRAGKKTKAVSFDNGFGWTVKSDASTAPNTAPDISADKQQADATLTDEGTITQSPETDTVAQNEQGDQAQPAQQEGKNIAGEMLNDEWQSFTKESGTKNIPRSEMPQIKAENRGAMVNFMKARDIGNEKDEVQASSLKPTQQEFSPAKVKKAMEFEGGNRSILVSNDGYVLDGHHQWLAAREKGESVKVTRLNAPIEQLVPLAKEMPSTETQDDAGKLTATGNEEVATTGKLNDDNGKQSEQKGVETAEAGKLIEQEPATTEQASELPPILKTTKRKWLQSQAKEQGLKKGSPGFDVAMAKIEEGYEPAIDRALAESSFETYKKFNDDTPEGINRMAYNELRKEFGIDDTPPPIKEAVKPAKKTEPPKSGFSLPESKRPEQLNSEEAASEQAKEGSASEGDTVKFFSKGSSNKAKGVSKVDAERAADNFLKSLKGAAGIKVKVLQTSSEAEKLWRMNLAGSVVKGAYSENSKTVYVIAENIDSESDLKQTLAHETIAHGGLDTVIGKDAKQAFIDRIKATKGRKAFEKYWKDANNDYWDASQDVKAEEIFARFVENEPTKGELKYWWQALKRFIRAQLDKVGLAYSEDTELTAMREMLESIVKGFKAQRTNSESANSELAYSKGDKKLSKTANTDTRTAKEKLGLVEQAKETIAQQAKSKIEANLNALKSAPFWNRLNEGIFDGLAGIKQAEDSVGITDVNKQGYVSARLAAGVSDVLHGVFNYGAPMWKDGIVQRKEGTKGLLEVFGMVGEDLNDWLAWMGAHRAEKLQSQGRENNLTKADIAELKALGNGKEKSFEKVREEYNKINSAILDLAQGAGLISKAQRAAFDEEYYVPFFRDMGETDSEMDAIKRTIIEPHVRAGIASQSAKIKELKGGKQSTKDLLENIITRQSTLIEASLKNKAMQEVVSNLDGTDFMSHEKSDEAKSRTQQQLNNDHKVRVMINGEPEAYLVSDPALLRSLIQINSSGSQNIVNKLGRSAKRFLTAGITLSPDFIAKNFIRDAVHAWMISKDGFKFGTDSYKGLKKAFKEDETYRDLIFSGAAFQGGYIHGADPEAAAQQTRRSLRSKGLTTKEVDTYMGSLITNGKQMLEVYRNVSDKVENANRLSTYESGLSAGKTKREAAFLAKDLMDYSLKGNFTTINFMIDMLPFFNARLQGMSKLVRASKASDGDQVLRVLSANLAMKGIKLAGLSLALAMYNDDDERYQELPDWDKDINWHFWAGEDHWRIPKPFELGVIFGTMPERLFNYAAGNQTDKDLQKSIMNAVLNTMALNPTPQFILPFVETTINKSFFRDAPIEGMADQNKQPEDRYSAHTSDIAISIGKQFGISPKKVEHIIKGYTGTIGGYVLGASDIVARQIMGKESADTPINRYPVIKAFYQGDRPKGSTKFADEFYNALDTANQAYGSYKRAMELGDNARIQELVEKEGAKIQSKSGLAKIQRVISKIGKAQKAINDSKELSGEQKRKQLDELQRQKNAVYHQAYVGFNLGEW